MSTLPALRSALCAKARDVWARVTRPRAGTKLRSVTLLLALSPLLLAAGDTTAARFNQLGHRMMCVCGCNQVLLECNHVGCTYSDKMRTQLAGFLAGGDNDSLVLQKFVQEYGTTVINAPATTGFGRVAWIMPFAALTAALGLAVVFIKRWQARPAAAMASSAPADFLGAPEVDALRARARPGTEILRPHSAL